MGVPIELQLNNATIKQTQYTIQHNLTGTSFVNNDSYYVTVQARNTAGSTNVTANSTTVCLECRREHALALMCHGTGSLSGSTT